MLIVLTFFSLIFFILRLKVANGDKFIVGHFQFPLHLHASATIYMFQLFLFNRMDRRSNRDNDDDNNFLINEHAICCAPYGGGG